MSATVRTSGTKRTCEAAVVGAGPAGLAGALALAHVGADVALIGPPPPKADAASAETRTAALLVSSVDFLKALKVFERVSEEAAPLKAIRIIDVSRSLIRAPDIEFRASELGLPAFGYNIANTALVEALYARAQEVLPAIIPASVERVTIEDDVVRTRLHRRERSRRPSGDGRRRTPLSLPRGRWNRGERVALRSGRHRLELPPRPRA